MRELTIGTQRHTKVICLDEPGAGGACHEYEVIPVKPHPDRTQQQERFAQVGFQNGSIKDVGVNGCTNEDLLAIVLDRLYGFQSGEFNCMENATAIVMIEKALFWLNHRTNERIKRGVEETLVK